MYRLNSGIVRLIFRPIHRDNWHRQAHWATVCWQILNTCARALNGMECFLYAQANFACRASAKGFDNAKLMSLARGCEFPRERGYWFCYAAAGSDSCSGYASKMDIRQLLPAGFFLFSVKYRNSTKQPNFINNL